MTSNARRPGTYTDESSTAYGVSIFAGVLLATTGVFQMFQGLAAILDDQVFVKGIDYVYAMDVTAWGWVHLIVGAVSVAVGLGILGGRGWALVTGMVLAVLGALAQFLFMPFYPFWALLLIAMYIVVLWALGNQWQSR